MSKQFAPRFLTPLKIEQPLGIGEIGAMHEQSSELPNGIERDHNLMTEKEAAYYLRIKVRQLYN